MKFVAGAGQTVQRRNGSGNGGGERFEEALVLLSPPVRHPDVSRTAQAGPAADHDSPLAERLDHLILLAVPQRDPREVRLRFRRIEIELADALLDEYSLHDRALHAAHHVVAVQDRLRGGDLRKLVDAERLANSVHGSAELGRTQGVAAPQARE